MEAVIKINNNHFKVDLAKPIDISIPMRSGEGNVSAWYVDPVSIEPVLTDQFTGSVKLGGSVNFRNITFNPHGNGTHTECVGHISQEDYSINQCLKEFFFLSKVVSINPSKMDNGDFVITKEHLELVILKENTKAIVIRTLPNTNSKKTRQYSNTNPPYIEASAIEFLTKCGIDHFLIDLPSVDKELDEGKLAAHHAFWEYPKNTQTHRTITELIFVPESCQDGDYLLNLQFASFENDASPSKPVLYAAEKI